MCTCRATGNLFNSVLELFSIGCQSFIHQFGYIIGEFLFISQFSEHIGEPVFDERVQTGFVFGYDVGGIFIEIALGAGLQDSDLFFH